MNKAELKSFCDNLRLKYLSLGKSKMEAYLNSSLKGLVVGLAVFLSLLLSQLSYAQEPSSFRSWNYPERYIRHRLSLGYIDPIVASDKLGRKDATFRLVPGLAGRCRSFESVNYPGHFLRHHNYRLKLAKQTDEQLFKEDATFCFLLRLPNFQAPKYFESLGYKVIRFWNNQIMNDMNGVILAITYALEENQ